MRVELRPLRLTLPTRRPLARLPRPADPLDRRLHADPEASRGATGGAFGRGAQNPIPQILTIGPRHRPSPDSGDDDSHARLSQGIPSESETQERALVNRVREDVMISIVVVKRLASAVACAALINAALLRLRASSTEVQGTP